MLFLTKLQLKRENFDHFQTLLSKKESALLTSVIWRDSKTNDHKKIERNIDGSSLNMKSLWRLVWAMRHQSFHQFFCFWCSILKKLWETSNTSDYFSSISIYLRRFPSTPYLCWLLIIINIVEKLAACIPEPQLWTEEQAKKALALRVKYDVKNAPKNFKYFQN